MNKVIEHLGDWTIKGLDINQYYPEQAWWRLVGVIEERRDLSPAAFALDQQRLISALYALHDSPDAVTRTPATQLAYPYVVHNSTAVQVCIHNSLDHWTVQHIGGRNASNYYDHYPFLPQHLPPDLVAMINTHITAAELALGRVPLYHDFCLILETT